MASDPLDPPSRDEFPLRRRPLRTGQDLTDVHWFESVEPEAPPNRENASPEHGGRASLGEVGPPLFLGLGLILIWDTYTLALRPRQPEFLRSETLKHEAAHRMRAEVYLVS